MSFDGRVALVTGGSRGIGASIVDEISSNGGSVFYTFRTWNEKAERDAKRSDVTNVYPMQCDVCDYGAVKTLIGDIIARRERIDFVVNNAAINRDKTLALMPPSVWTEVIAVNLTGVFHVCRCAILKMIQQKFGKIVNIVSVGGLISPPYQSNYAASKAGVISLTKSLAKEVAAHGITVNAVAPGFIHAGMTSALPEKQRNACLGAIPMNRFGEASEVASLVGYLLSDKANYITGEVIRIDGGLGA